MKPTKAELQQNKQEILQLLEMAKKLEELGEPDFVRQFYITALEGFREGERLRSNFELFEKIKNYHANNPASVKPGETRRLYADFDQEIILYRDEETGMFHLEMGIFREFWFTTVINLKTNNIKKAKKLRKRVFDPTNGLEVAFVSDAPEAAKLVTRWAVV